MGKTYIGVSGKARQVKRIYVGVSDVARKVKRAYVGDANGVARLVYNAGIFRYFGPLSSLDVNCEGDATSVGKYAVFASGQSSGTVRALDGSVTQHTASALSVPRYDFAATTLGNYALFAGGYGRADGVGYVTTVDTYNTSLTKGTATGLSQARGDLAATTVGGYALFAGGQYDTSTEVKTVDAYNASLTRTTATALPKIVIHHAATTVGNYALFAGGTHVDWEASGLTITSTTYITNTIVAYDSSLTQQTISGLTQYKCNMAATTVGGYALFAGGWGLTANNTTAEYFSTVDAYNTSLTKMFATALVTAKENACAVTLIDRAIVAGGNDGDYDYKDIDYYDSSLTKITASDDLYGAETVFGAAGSMIAATAGEYAYFCNGATLESFTYKEDFSFSFVVDSTGYISPAATTWGTYIEAYDASGDFSIVGGYVIKYVPTGYRLDVELDDALAPERYFVSDYEVKTISFTVNGTTYSCYNGDDWYDVVNYHNSSNLFAVVDTYITYDGEYIDTGNSSIHWPAGLRISAGEAYTTVGYSVVTFVVDGTTYTVESGTTWDTFINSSASGDLFSDDHDGYVMYDGQYLSGYPDTESFIRDGTYTLTSVTPGEANG